MLRKFKISIDGTAYLVEMEEVGATATPADAVAPAASASVPTGAHTQTAPMPGKIVDIKVNVGDTVKVNQPVLILEAMKMESEIVAEQDGVIASINVAKGDMVNPGDTLFSLS
ncbi:biotin/lipoyl-containing protein [Collinsella sp. An307]|uniref:biotin/lipoyl-containing protein n=1 Tax=Collinsella sp. An307 TaxID=1965630 RepID=UPI000B36CEDE|nr:biotin/lipoyl-containing protein [Collinsella sp. An307]OUO21330.1 acetyl-CoA carboxylase biotin carboxyl carrier protein subunit [Collinsella sp. An307]